MRGNKNEPLPLDDDDDDQPLPKSPSSKGKPKKSRVEDDDEDEPEAKSSTNRANRKKQHDEEEEEMTLAERWGALSTPAKYGIMGGVAFLTGIGICGLIALALSLRGSNKPTAGSGDSDSDSTAYTIKAPEIRVGTKVLVVEREVRKATEVSGAKTETGTREASVRYIEHVLAISDGRPSKLTRNYQEAQTIVNGNAKSADYEGKLVMVERNGDLYDFSLSGRKLSSNQAKEIGLVYSGRTEHGLARLPAQPVRIGETWNYDQNMLRDIMKGQPTLDPEKSSISGKLVKTYTSSDAVRWGVLEYKSEIVSTKTRGELEPEKINGTTTLEVPIDGNSFESKVNIHLEYVLSIKEEQGKTHYATVEVNIARSYTSLSADPINSESAPSLKSNTKTNPSGESSKVDISLLPETLNERHDGRDAQSWGEQLLDGNERLSQEAAFALRKMGPEALRFVVVGFESRLEAVRWRSLFIALDTDSAAKYPKVFRPALIKLLKDSSPLVRSTSLKCLIDFKFEGTDQIIRQAIADEPNPDTKRKMQKDLDRSLGKVVDPPPPYKEFVSLHRKNPKTGEDSDVESIPAIRTENNFVKSKERRLQWQLLESAVKGSISEGDTITDERGTVLVVTKNQILRGGGYITFQTTKQ